MKTIFRKTALSTALVAAGLVIHLSAAFAADSGKFDTNIAVTTAACQIQTSVDDTSPFTATANFSSTNVANNSSPSMTVDSGVRAVTVESNCPLVGITMVPSTALKFAGSVNAPNIAVTATSDGQWPMDFFWSRFEVYTGSASIPDASADVRLGNGGYGVNLTYGTADTPVVAAGTTKRWYWEQGGSKDSAGNDIKARFSAPMYKYQGKTYELATSFTTNTSGGTSATPVGRNNGVLSVGSLASGDKQKFVAYIGSMFGTTPYGLDGYPMASAVMDGETVTLSRTLTVTAS